MIDIRIDQQQLGSLLGLLDTLPKGLATAASRAGNRTLITTRAEMVRLIRAKYAIKAGDVRGELVIRRMNPNQLKGSIFGQSSPGVPLIRFYRLRRTPSTRRTKAGGYSPRIGVPVLVRKDKGKRTVRGAFTARMSSGHEGMFVRGSKWKASKKGNRSGLGKREIIEFYGPTPVKLLGGADNLATVEVFAQQTLDKNLAHEAEFLLGQKGLL